MAHFAELGENNVVLRVIIISNDDIKDPDTEQEDELTGIAFCKKITGGGRWLQTSYNTYGGVHKLGGTPLRKNYAGVGMKYDVGRDAFIYEKPFPSWVLNETTCLWEAPVPRPDQFKPYEWDEATLSWVDPLPSNESLPVSEF